LLLVPEVRVRTADEEPLKPRFTGKDWLPPRDSNGVKLIIYSNLGEAGGTDCSLKEPSAAPSGPHMDRTKIAHKMMHTHRGWHFDVMGTNGQHASTFR